MSPLNPKLTKDQERNLCSMLGAVKLSLLYKATVDGYTAHAFHQICDNKGPTFVVAYNRSGYVFGGYTSKNYAQTMQHVNDAAAFLFTFRGNNPLRFPVVDSQYARLDDRQGPNFGNGFIFLHNNTNAIYNGNSRIFNIDPATMYGNDVQITECEVYCVEGTHVSSITTVMATLNPKLTKDQERNLCSMLGAVKLSLLYKASVHGYTTHAFHQICDNKGPTFIVAYNRSGYVFGGYTSKNYAQTMQHVNDAAAFLFTFRGNNPLRFPVVDSQYARLDDRQGPNFGNGFIFLHNNTNAIYNGNSRIFNIDPATMYGNDVQITECEVYCVEEIPALSKPWRNVLWEETTRNKLMECIKNYKPLISSVSQVRVLLIGPVGAGKSSFFNSINSIYRGHVTSQAIAGQAGTSVTTQFRTYNVKAGREGKPLPFVLCDTMGLEEQPGSGLDIDDIRSILNGRVPDRYKFNPSAPLQSEDRAFCNSITLNDKIHCVVYVLDTCKVSLLPATLEDKLTNIRRMVNQLGIPQIVLLTKVDEACPKVEEDLQNVYVSQYIKTKVREISIRLGVPMNCILPVKNYSQELELDLNSDILLLSAILQILRFGDNYLDDNSPVMEKETMQSPH